MASSLEVEFANHSFILDAQLALYWPQKSTLVVSDLHLEKSTFLAQSGSPIAPYDTLDTLLRLERLIARYQPKSLIMLGDVFHDNEAWLRLENSARAQLLSICQSVQSCHLVEGNHDFGLMSDDRLQFAGDVLISGITFRHEPAKSDEPQIIGHFHPRMHTSICGRHFAGKCFAINQTILIMPSFGSFTGGLDMSSNIFAALGGDDPLQPFLVYKNTVARTHKTDTDPPI